MTAKWRLECNGLFSVGYEWNEGSKWSHRLRIWWPMTRISIICSMDTLWASKYGQSMGHTLWSIEEVIGDWESRAEMECTNDRIGWNDRLLVTRRKRRDDLLLVLLLVLQLTWSNVFQSSWECQHLLPSGLRTSASFLNSKNVSKIIIPVAVSLQQVVSQRLYRRPDICYLQTCSNLKSKKYSVYEAKCENL